jgi:hypothetical protein
MNKNEFYPELRLYKGSGSIKSKTEEIELDFGLVIYPHTIRIFSDYNVGFFSELGNWSFQGQIENGQIAVSSSVLMLFSATEKSIVLMPKNEFIIGEFDKEQIISARFPLIGYYGDKAEFDFENFRFRLNGNKHDAAKQERLSKIWNTQLEGFCLEIEGANLSSDDYVVKAMAISDLLSLAIGNVIGFNRQLYFSSNNHQYEIFREQHLADFGVYSCVPNFRITDFLSSCFPVWVKQLNDLERKTIRVAVNYINSTSIGYLEERVLRIAQAWELVSTDWIGDINEVPEEIEDLKHRLKDVLKMWRKDFPEVDKTGFWNGRVLGALSWDKSIFKAERLASEYRVNLDVIKLDLKKLFDDRNSVAHSGRFKDYTEDRIPLIDSAVFGLQLILLRKLGYLGLVHTSENGWTTYKKIEEFIIN